MNLFKRIANEIQSSESFGLFKRRIPTFAEFVSSPMYLNQSPLFKSQQAAFDIPFGRNPELFFSKSKQYSKIALCYGKGSGKAFYAAYSLSYLIYVLNSHLDIYSHLGIPDKSPLDILIVASSQNQSSGIVYTRLCRCLDSPAFRTLGVKIGKETTTLEPSITIRAMSSNPASLEGFSPILSLMDEAAGFRDASGNSSAEEVYGVLATSAHSRFLNASTVFITSYPRRHNDFIMRIVARAEKDRSIWADKKASWEVRDDRTEEDYASQFTADFDTASAFYGCNPPLGFGLWFANQDLVAACFGKLQSEVSHHPSIRNVGDKSYISIDIDECKPVSGATYYAHGDPGLKNDAFALAVGRKGEGGSVDIVALLRWKPDNRRGQIVDLENVKDVILQLNRHFHFAQVTFDSFQSASIIQSLLDGGVQSGDLSFSSTQQLEMYRNLRSLVDAGNISILADAVALREMRELERRDNARPDHPYGGSKDLADCIAAVALAISSQSAGVSGLTDSLF